MKDAMQVDIVELQSATNFGRLMAVFLWIYGLMSPISGMIADRLNRNVADCRQSFCLVFCNLFDGYCRNI